MRAYICMHTCGEKTSWTLKHLPVEMSRPQTAARPNRLKPNHVSTQRRGGALRLSVGVHAAPTPRQAMFCGLGDEKAVTREMQ